MNKRIRNKLTNTENKLMAPRGEGDVGRANTVKGVESFKLLVIQ